MHIGDVSLQVSLEIAAVSTVGAFKVLHLDLRGAMIIMAGTENFSRHPGHSHKTYTVY